MRSPVGYVPALVSRVRVPSSSSGDLARFTPRGLGCESRFGAMVSESTFDVMGQQPFGNLRMRR